MEDFRKTRRWDAFLPTVFEKLFWVEISAGRLPHAVWYFDLYISTKRQSVDHDEAAPEWQEAIRNKDGVLAMLLLTADERQTRDVARMLPFFETAGLHACALSALFAAGGPEALRAERYFPEEQTDQDVWDFFKLMWNQPAQSQLPDRLETFEGETVRLVSHVLGRSGP